MLNGPEPAAFPWREPKADRKGFSTSTRIVSASGTRKGREENQAFQSARGPYTPPGGVLAGGRSSEPAPGPDITALHWDVLEPKTLAYPRRPCWQSCPSPTALQASEIKRLPGPRRPSR